MAYVWNQLTGKHEWSPGAGGNVSAFELGMMAPSPTVQQQYTLGARTALGGAFQDRPGAASYVTGMRDPLYGQYLMSGETHPDAVMARTNQSFQDWLQGATPVMDTVTGITPDRQSRFAGFSPSGAIGGAGSTDWKNIVNIARGMQTGGSPESYAGVDTGAYDRWASVLGDDNRAMALANMAMYRNPGGDMLSRDLRNRGLNRMYESWAAPLADQATGANWLAYITGQDRPTGLIREGYAV